MSKYQVYHETMPTFGFGPTKTFPDDFTLVAETEADSIEEVFTLTNHIEEVWYNNPGVNCLDRRARSTSVGDVVVDEKGFIHLCLMMGWRAIGLTGSKIQLVPVKT